ncbi:MAG: hypothetical protein P1U81_06630 [Verrucomicrobiales bacterium]|nr:hypothetical protein [Verrucomicrobiales bacterium]
MNRHRQAILVHGYAVPAALAVLLLGVIFYVRSQVSEEMEKRELAREELRMVKAQVSLLEEFMGSGERRGDLTTWEELGREDFFHKFTQLIDRTLSEFPPGSLRRTAMGQAPVGGAVTGPTNLPHSRIALTFEGYFQEMQTLLATFESEMPALMLESLEVTRGGVEASTGGGPYLIFRIVYLHWDAPAIRT